MPECFNEKMELMKELQKEMEKRQAAYKEVSHLMGNGEFEKAKQVLSDLDDGIVLKLMDEVEKL